MLEQDAIDRILDTTLRETLPGVVSVQSWDHWDWTGADALRVLVKLRDEALEEITGDQALNALHQVQDRLQLAGEERFAFLEYITESEELAEREEQEAAEREEMTDGAPES